MLILRHMLKAASLMHAYGELRPGYLDHGTSGLKGPFASPHQNFNEPKLTNLEEVPESTRSKKDGRCVEITLSIEEDPETGEYLFVRK